MFFPNRITNIKPTDRVLEVGPGGSPYERSDIFLEISASDEELAAQRGYTQKTKLKKPVVFYKGSTFPFKDNEFDYVVCSHVIEHVNNPAQFASELFRVAKRGYIEYPTIYYEYLYNFDVHKSFVKFDTHKNTLVYIKKSKTRISDFAPVQGFFYRSLTLGYVDIIDDLVEHMIEGFEWNKPFSIVEGKTIDQVCSQDTNINKKNALNEETNRNGLLRRLFK